MIVQFAQGEYQHYRYRLDDLTVQGRVLIGQFPIRRSTWRLNGGEIASFFVDDTPNLTLRAGRRGGWFANPIDWRTGYKDTPSGLRLPDLGMFNIEIPTGHPDLRVGENELVVEIEDHGKEIHRSRLRIDWNPEPLAVELDLRDLSAVTSIQQVGQVVNGEFEVDSSCNLIRSVTPADPDSLLVLGSPHGSQEATFRIRFPEPATCKYLGVSDFFVRNEEEAPPIGIKPGYSTAGLATARFDGEARVWISWGDNAQREEGWLVCSEPAAEFFAEAGVAYRVRHQLILGAQHLARWRIWREGQPEPQAWLCEEHDGDVDASLPRFDTASFALFQHTGSGAEWSDIMIRPIADQS